jgi:hypothetical protein
MHKLRLIFGTSKIHHLPFEKRRLELLSEVSAAGVDTFDTAMTYGHGCAVETLSKFRKQCPSIKINSKIGLKNAAKRTNYFLEQVIRRKLFARQNADYRIRTLKDLQQQLNESLKTLGCERLNGCYIHEPLLDEFFIEELKEFRFQNRDKFKFLGIGAPSVLISRWNFTLTQNKIPIQTSLYDCKGNWLEPEQFRYEGDNSYGLFTATSQLDTRSKIKRVALSERSLVVATNKKKHFQELIKYVNL